MSNDNAPPSPRQVLLSVFIVGQLAFLVAGNLLGFVKWLPGEVSAESKPRVNEVLPKFAEKSGHGWAWAEAAEGATRNYMQLTGQDQDWALFAPAVGKMTGFPGVLLRWDEATPDDTSIAGSQFTYDPKTGFNMRIDGEAARLEVLRSDNEPADVRAFFRCTKCRLRRYEGQLWFDAQPINSESAEECARRLTERVRDFASGSHDVIVTYLRWRLKSWQARHPGELTPKQVILLQRSYRIHDPEEPRGWDGPTVIPIARWLPKLVRSEHAYVLESFDFTDKHFVRLK